MFFKFSLNTTCKNILCYGTSQCSTQVSHSSQYLPLYESDSRWLIEDVIPKRLYGCISESSFWLSDDGVLCHLFCMPSFLSSFKKSVSNMKQHMFLCWHCFRKHDLLRSESEEVTLLNYPGRKQSLWPLLWIFLWIIIYCHIE